MYQHGKVNPLLIAEVGALVASAAPHTLLNDFGMHVSFHSVVPGLRALTRFPKATQQLVL
jgi:hypothetical protein